MRLLTRISTRPLPAFKIPNYIFRLRTIGSVGEPINVAAWTWLHEIVGRVENIARLIEGLEYYNKFRMYSTIIRRQECRDCGYLVAN